MNDLLITIAQVLIAFAGGLVVGMRYKSEAYYKLTEEVKELKAEIVNPADQAAVLVNELQAITFLLNDYYKAVHEEQYERASELKKELERRGVKQL